MFFVKKKKNCGIYTFTLSLFMRFILSINTQDEICQFYQYESSKKLYHF